MNTPKIDSKAPAFPHTEIIGINGSLAGAATNGGMTIHDYFVAKALVGVLRGETSEDGLLFADDDETYLGDPRRDHRKKQLRRIAKDCLDIADAIMAERARRNGETA